MTTIEQCGICGIITGLLRRIMCGGNRRSSNESCYRALGNQEQLSDHVSSDESLPSEVYEISSTPETDFVPKTFNEHVNVYFKEGVTDYVFEAPARTGQFSSPQCQRRRRTIPVAHLLDDVYSSRLQALLRRTTQWNFDSGLLDSASGGRCLPVLCMYIFHKHGLIKFFGLRPENCWKLFVSIEGGYHDRNPYHNSVHAADVTQAIHCFLMQKSLRHHMKPMEVLVALLAAITHDLDHPGVNINHLIATDHPLTILYKDPTQVSATTKELMDNMPPIQKGVKKVHEFMKLLASNSKAIKNDGRKLDKGADLDKAGPSGTNNKICTVPEILPPVLEHHHWRAAYSYILQSKVFDHMKEQLPKIRTMLKSLILATDITRQTHYITKFKELVERKKLKLDKDEHRHLVLQMALKTADISNPGRPWAISRAWSLKVCEEFFLQGDRERALRLPVAELCDRLNNTVPKIQIGFFIYVVLPLYRQWHNFAKDQISREMIENLYENQRKWERIQAEGLGLMASLETSMSSNFISSANVVSRNLNSSTISCCSDQPTTFRLKPRRCSTSPVKPMSVRVRDSLRRWSDPFGMFTSRDVGSRAISRTQRDSIQEVSPARSKSAALHAQDAAGIPSPPEEPTPPPTRYFQLATPQDNVILSTTIRAEAEDARSESLLSTRSGSSLPSQVSHLRRLFSDSRLSQPRSDNGKSSDFSFDWAMASFAKSEVPEAKAWSAARRGSAPATAPMRDQRGRRGSAPLPDAGAAAERRVLITSLSLHHGLAGRRKHAPFYQKLVVPAHKARRGSLPVEDDFLRNETLITEILSMKLTNK